MIFFTMIIITRWQKLSFSNYLFSYIIRFIVDQSPLHREFFWFFFCNPPICLYWKEDKCSITSQDLFGNLLGRGSKPNFWNSRAVALIGQGYRISILGDYTLNLDWKKKMLITPLSYQAFALRESLFCTVNRVTVLYVYIWSRFFCPFFAKF